MRDLSVNSSTTLLLLCSCLAVCFCTLVAEEPTEFWPAGNPECPCIDPLSRGLQLNPGNSHPTVCGLVHSPETTPCYNRSYGSQGCKQYDWNATSECALALKEDWCDAQWCYVDGTNCSRDFAKSEFFPSATISSESGTQPLVYSYATCGWVDTFSNAVESLLRAAASRPNGKLRVAFPGNSGSGYTVVGPPQVQPGQGVGGTNLSGSFLSFMADAFKRRSNIPWEEVPISLRSRQYGKGSSFTACVHEVAIGNADMCWGNFWPTAVRSRIASFAQPVYNDKFHVVVYKQDDGVNFWEAMLKPFLPFAPSLWCILLLVFAYSGIVMNYHQDGGERPCFSTSFFFQLPRSILQGWQAMFSGAFNGVETRSLGGWLVTITAGFTVLVMFTGYTAVVTTDLLAARQQGTVQSLEEGIKRGLRFCSNADLKELLLARYPEMEPAFVETSLGAAADRMDDGDCDAAVIHEDLWYNIRAKSDKHCIGKAAKVKLPQVVTTIGNSVPVQPELVPAVSWMIRKEIESGRYVRYQKQAQSEFRKPACAERNSDMQKKEFVISDMAGPLSLLGVMATVSLIITFISTRVARKAKQFAEALDDDGDGSVSYSDVVSAVRRLSGSEAGSPTPTSSRAPRAPSYSARVHPMRRTT